MEGKNDSRERGTKLVMRLQGGVLEWAQAEGRADGIAECTALLRAFCQPGTTKFPPEFQTLVDMFEHAAAALYAGELERLRAVRDLAGKFRESVKTVTEIPSHARVEYRALDEVLNGSTPESDTRPPAAGGSVSNGAAAANVAAPGSSDGQD